MKSRQDKSSSHVLAAGGVVHRGRRSPLIAVVQRRKDNTWVLPKGKLKPRESLLCAARREVMEETGHRVTVREYLGAISYDTGGKSKIVQFWRMTGGDVQVRKPMDDIKAVKWLRLAEALELLQQPLERAFLMQVGARLRQAARARRAKTRLGDPEKKSAVSIPTANESQRRPGFFERLIGRTG